MLCFKSLIFKVTTNLTHYFRIDTIMHDMRWKASAVTLKHDNDTRGSRPWQFCDLDTGPGDIFKFLLLFHPCHRPQMCVWAQRKRLYLLEQGLCVCVGDCACCLHSLPMKVQSICLGTWKKKSSQCHNRSEPYKKIFSTKLFSTMAFLISNFKKKKVLERHCPTCSTSVKAAQVTLYNLKLRTDSLSLTQM